MRDRETGLGVFERGMWSFVERYGRPIAAVLGVSAVAVGCGSPQVVDVRRQAQEAQDQAFFDSLQKKAIPTATQEPQAKVVDPYPSEIIDVISHLREPRIVKPIVLRSLNPIELRPIEEEGKLWYYYFPVEVGKLRVRPWNWNGNPFSDERESRDQWESFESNPEDPWPFHYFVAVDNNGVREIWAAVTPRPTRRSERGLRFLPLYAGGRFRATPFPFWGDSGPLAVNCWMRPYLPPSVAAAAGCSPLQQVSSR